MEYLASDKVAIVDLGSGQVSEDELDEALVAEKLGGAGITTHLYKEHEADNPIVLGAGLLTGTLTPASALGLMTAKSPLTGQLCHVPLTQYLGIEIKYSGFDYLVIKGAAASPVYLWVHDGIADISPAGDLWGQDSWQAVNQVRQAMGDDLIQVLGIGPAGEQGRDTAQVLLNLWGSADRFGLGKLMGAKNLKLVALRGMGLLEIADPDGFVEQTLALLGEVKAGAWAGKAGLGDLAAGLGEPGLADWLAPVAHRHRACFNTPFASNTYAMLEGDPKEMTEPQEEAPGFLLSDVGATLAFYKMGLSAAEAAEIMRSCAQTGLDPAAVADLAAAAGHGDAAAISAGLSSYNEKAPSLGQARFSPWIPGQAIFAPGGDQDWWLRRQAVAHIFGLHPLFALMAPEISEEKLLALANLGTELELDQETLDKVVAEVTA